MTKQSLFGEYVFQLRRRKKMQQKQVALAAKIDPSYLAGIENGRRDPPSEKLIEKLLDALGAKPFERKHAKQLARVTRLTRLMEAEDGTVPGVEIARRLLECAPKLSPEELAAFDTLLLGLHDRPAFLNKEAAM